MRHCCDGGVCEVAAERKVQRVEMRATALRHFQHSSIRNILCETEVFPHLDWRPLCTGVSYRSSALETCCVYSSVEFLAHERESIHGSVLLDTTGCVCREHEYEGSSHDFIGQPLSHDTEPVQCSLQCSAVGAA